MGIAIVIISGLVVMTIVGAGFDFLTKRNKTNADISFRQLKDLEDRIKILETNEVERIEQIIKIQDEVKFMNKLLEDKSKSYDKT
jgi:hypothetical protein